MIGPKIYSNDKEVIVSEHFMTFDDQPSELKFILNNETFILQLKFTPDDKKKDSNIDFNIAGDKLVVNFTNFNSTLGMGNLDPIAIAESLGKQIFMNVWISRPNAKIDRRLINITLYKEVN